MVCVAFSTALRNSLLLHFHGLLDPLHYDFLPIGIIVGIACDAALLVACESPPATIVTHEESVLCHRQALSLYSSPFADQATVLDAVRVPILDFMAGPIVLPDVILKRLCVS